MTKSAAFLDEAETNVLADNLAIPSKEMPVANQSKQQTREELRKCSWPTWEELKGSTALIIVMIGLLGGFVVVIDRVLFTIFIR